MLFNSLAFFVFAFFFFLLWPVFRGKSQPRWIFIVIASLIFYGWWDWRFLFLLLGVATCDFLLGWWMDSTKGTRNRKWLLAFSIVLNIGALGVFKYANFSVHNLNWLLGVFGLNHNVLPPNIILPIGISFYIFQGLSYVWDIYRRELTHTRNYLHFLAFLSLFPQLVAGPIIRGGELLQQLRTPGNPTKEAQWEGFRLIIWGFFKKVIIANHLAPFISLAFRNLQTSGESTLYWWVVAFAFGIQIYGDFCGYSDIARGLARWMGYSFPLNFNNPYQSTSFGEFWSRWHITLSRWIRDYVYISFGGNRCGKIRTYINLMAAMLISGFWHGAAWTYVIWGGLHGFYLVVEKLTAPWTGRLPAPIRRYFGWILCLLLTMVAWVFFRANDLPQALTIVKMMFNCNFSTWHAPIYGKIILIEIIMLGYVLLTMHGFTYQRLMEKKFLSRLEPWLLVLIGIVSVFLRGPDTSFIYFQF